MARARATLCRGLTEGFVPCPQGCTFCTAPARGTHKVCPLCSCFQALSSPSTAKAASDGSSASGAHSMQLLGATQDVLLFPSFSLESSQAQDRIPAHLHSDNTAFQKANPKQWTGCRHIHLSSPKSTRVACECLVTPLITC